MQSKWFQSTRSFLPNRMEDQLSRSLLRRRKKINGVSKWMILTRWIDIRRVSCWPHRGCEALRTKMRRTDCTKTTWSTPISESMSSWLSRCRMTISDTLSMLFWRRCTVKAKETKSTQVSTKTWLRRLYSGRKTGTSLRTRCCKSMTGTRTVLVLVCHTRSERLPKSFTSTSKAS